MNEVKTTAKRGEERCWGRTSGGLSDAEEQQGTQRSPKQASRVGGVVTWSRPAVCSCTKSCRLLCLQHVLRQIGHAVLHAPFCKNKRWRSFVGFSKKMDRGKTESSIFRGPYAQRSQAHVRPRNRPAHPCPPCQVGRHVQGRYRESSWQHLQ